MMALTLRRGKLPNFYTSMSQRICLGNKGNLMLYSHYKCIRFQVNTGIGSLGMIAPTLRRVKLNFPNLNRSRICKLGFCNLIKNLSCNKNKCL